MKYIKLTLTLILIVYIGFLSDTIYTNFHKEKLKQLEGVQFAVYWFLSCFTRFVVGFFLGRNILRINNFIWK